MPATSQRKGQASRKFYTITGKGREGLAVIRGHLHELNNWARTE